MLWLKSDLAGRLNRASSQGWGWDELFREALQKTGVNIKPILLRLKDRENAENDRNFDRKSINFPLFEMEFLRNWFGNPAQAR